MAVLNALIGSIMQKVVMLYMAKNSGDLALSLMETTLVNAVVIIMFCCMALSILTFVKSNPAKLSNLWIKVLLVLLQVIVVKLWILMKAVRYYC